jgi:hypothetical protein
MLSIVSALCALAGLASSTNFDWEQIQLNNNHAGRFPAIAFGDLSENVTTTAGASPACRAFPGTKSWPSRSEWDQLNDTMEGALLKPLPAGVVCYPGPRFNSDRCSYLARAAGATRFYLDDPLTSLTQWTQGNTCLVNADAKGNCTRGGFPTYVVNATNVRQIQAAVNFARNRNIRLVIK